ncbi:MAG TPA: hypothetical protein VK866_11440, partial [Acidimicrobiales bacterium]|nr:hypothetical protein [Acidimicrobiales bacterium]
MTEPPATDPPDDAALVLLGDRLATDPALVAELLADPGGWARAHRLGDDQLDRLRALVTERATA